MRICIGDPVPSYESRNELLLADAGTWSSDVGVNCAEEIVLNYALAPLSPAETERLLSNVARTLKPGGRVRVMDVDGFSRNPTEPEHVGGGGHKPTVANLSSRLFKYGFQVLPVQYHDASGKFRKRRLDRANAASWPTADHGESLDRVSSGLMLEAQLIFDHQKGRQVSEQRRQRKHRMSLADALDVFRGVFGPAPVTDRRLERAVAEHPSTASLCAELLASPEFQKTLPAPVAIEHITRKDMEPVFERFRFGSASGTKGFFTGALGDRIDIRFANYLAKVDGQVATEAPFENIGVPVNQPTEYFPVLQSVLNSDGKSYVAAELGAGFGPWVVRGALAAQQLGIADIRLAAVEADPMHYEWLRAHFSNNGLDPTQHKLLCGAVGASDGIAYFPEIDDPALDWGAPSVSEQGMQDMLLAGKTVDRRGQEFREVTCYSIASVIADFDRVDLLHIDIQGQELDSIRSSAQPICEKVKMMFIGTHESMIDAELIRFLTRNGWELKHIWPRDLLRSPEGRPAGIADGEQLWINRALS